MIDRVVMRFKYLENVTYILDMFIIILFNFWNGFFEWGGIIMVRGGMW